MGYDAVRGVNTYGARCLPGAARQFAWWQANYQAGSLGCYNPASKASGGPSLHAEGRAMDIALNANDPAQRARGDAIVARVVANPEQFGAQEMLWRGGVWSWRNRHLGWRQNGTQQAAHMNHVHLGLDVNAAQNWTESWVTSGPAPATSTGDDMPSVLETIALLSDYVVGAPAQKRPDGQPLSLYDRLSFDDNKRHRELIAKLDELIAAQSDTRSWFARLWPKKAARA